MLLVSAFLFLVAQPKVAHATTNFTLPKPYWWTNASGVYNDCDAYHFNQGPPSGQTAHLLSTWNGLEACGYGPNQGGSDVVVTFPGGSQENEWECTELVKRYLYLAYGTQAISQTNGSQVVDTYTGNRTGYTGYPNVFSKVLNNGNFHVQVGDVLSYSGTDNHTAIVIATNEDVNGNGTITVLEQNTSLSQSTGQHTQTVSGWVIKHGVDDQGSTDTVAAWLHPTPLGAWSDNSPSGTTHDSINAMAASSTTNVWAAGNEGVSCGTSEPVTYHNDGTGWTRFLIPYSCSNYPYSLNGIASSSSSNAWAVGGYYPNGGQTLAYHWTCSSNCSGSSWTQVTSDNPDPTTCCSVRNQLLGVNLDGSGTPWAVGSYGGNGSYQTPLLEKWNGTKFAQQTLPSLGLPTPNTGVLNGISFSSSTNGWAVGAVSWWSGGWKSGYLIYQYSNGSWTATTGADGTGGLNSVIAISDSEAWAVGNKGNGAPLILHYASGSWTEDTSFNGNYPSGVYLQSVSADSSSDVVVAGYINTGTPYTMKNFGYGWTQVTTPSVSGSTLLYGVAVVSGQAFAGGKNTPSGQSYNLPVTFAYSS
jgi:hypothetical protein